MELRERISCDKIQRELTKKFKEKEKIKMERQKMIDILGDTVMYEGDLFWVCKEVKKNQINELVEYLKNIYQKIKKEENGPFSIIYFISDSPLIKSVRLKRYRCVPENYTDYLLNHEEIKKWSTPKNGYYHLVIQFCFNYKHVLSKNKIELFPPSLD